MADSEPPASAVTIFHRTDDVSGFREYAAELTACASAAQGYVAERISILDKPELDWAVVITFRTETLLHEWLDSAERGIVLEAGQQRGIWRRTSDLVLREGMNSPPGIGMFTHSVVPGREADFVAAQVELTATSSTFAGYEGTVVMPAGVAGEWVSLLRFRSARQLSKWMSSAERNNVLPKLRANLTEDFSFVTNTTPFGTSLRIEDGKTTVTPNWKIAMMILLVLYPTVMLLSRFLGPILDRAGAEPWLALWLSQVVSVTLMTWWLSPWAAKPFERWLDPVTGRGVRINVIGAGVVAICYLVTLVIFANIKWLQFWDYMD